MTEINNNFFFFFNSFAGLSTVLDQTIIFFASYLAYVLSIVFILSVFFLNTSRTEKIKVVVSAIIAGVVSRGIIVEIIRFFYHHPRPSVALFGIHSLLIETTYSFPSGHATLFFALSAVMYKFNKKIGFAFFILSTAMGIARIAAGVHYPFDILGGAILGTLAGFGITFAVETYFRKYGRKFETSLNSTAPSKE